MVSSSLDLTAVDNLGLDSRADGAGGGAEGLDLLHHSHGLGVSDLAEDDVLAVEPRGDNGGDEELGAVAIEEKEMVSVPVWRKPRSPSGKLTCWDQRWPWRAGRGGRACA